LPIGILSSFTGLGIVPCGPEGFMRFIVADARRFLQAYVEDELRLGACWARTVTICQATSKCIHIIRALA
jgi:hypothetical protein